MKSSDYNNKTELRSVVKQEELNEKEKKTTIKKISCCDSDSEIERLSAMGNLEWIRKECNSSYKSTIYLLKFNQHEFHDPIVEYYNPRKGLEFIDGSVYNQMPETTSRYKAIQYKFNFSSKEVSKKQEIKEKLFSIKLDSIFDEIEMKQILGFFNEFKEHRHTRKIKFKE